MEAQNQRAILHHSSARSRTSPPHRHSGRLQQVPAVVAYSGLNLLRIRLLLLQLPLVVSSEVRRPLNHKSRPVCSPNLMHLLVLAAPRRLRKQGSVSLPRHHHQPPQSRCSAKSILKSQQTPASRPSPASVLVSQRLRRVALLPRLQQQRQACLAT